MALRNIITEKDEILRKKSKYVTVFDRRLSLLLDDMRETMSTAGGLGLAAVQVGMLKRVVVVQDVDSIIELVNPKIVYASGEQVGSEGCLSVPGVYGQVKRPKKVTVRAHDRFGNVFEITKEDMTARAFCHEIDHLDGILFRDHVIKYDD